MSTKPIADALGIEHETPTGNVVEEFSPEEPSSTDVENSLPSENGDSAEYDAEEIEKDAITEMFGEEPEIGHVEQDYEFTRTKMRNIIEKGEEALNNLIEMVGEEPTARGYEVVSTMLKTMTDMGSQFFELQKKNRDLHQGDFGRLGEKPTNMRIQNGVVFTGDSASMLEYIKQKKKENG